MILPSWTKSLTLRKSFNLIRKSKRCRWLSWLWICQKYLARSSLTQTHWPVLVHVVSACLMGRRMRGGELAIYLLFSVVWLCSHSRTDMPTVRPCQLWPPGPPSWIHSFYPCGQPGLHRLHTTPHHTTPLHHHITLPHRLTSTPHHFNTISPIYNTTPLHFTTPFHLNTTPHYYTT